MTDQITARLACGCFVISHRDEPLGRVVCDTPPGERVEIKRTCRLHGLQRVEAALHGRVEHHF